VDPRDLEIWGRPVVDRAAEAIMAAIPAAQQPTIGAPGRAISAGRGYVARYVHFRRPDYPAQHAVWLFVVPPRHPYNIGGPQTRAGAGLMHDPDTELDESPFAAGLARGGPFRWQRHNNPDYAGYRLAFEIDPSIEPADAVATKLAADVVRGLRRARLIP
jgi:hypothetical protein